VPEAIVEVTEIVGVIPAVPAAPVAPVAPSGRTKVNFLDERVTVGVDPTAPILTAAEVTAREPSAPAGPVAPVSPVSPLIPWIPCGPVAPVAPLEVTAHVTPSFPEVETVMPETLFVDEQVLVESSCNGGRVKEKLVPSYESEAELPIE